MPSRSRYRWGPLTLSAAIALPELQTATRPAADWTVRWAPRRPAPRHWYHHWRHPKNGEWLSFGRDGRRYVLRFERAATFRIDPVRRRIDIEKGSGLPFDGVTRLLLNQVLPLVAGLSQVVLHASAVRTPAGAIGFAGDSGAGKSTLAAAMCRRGAVLMSDDALILRPHRQEWMVTPSYPGLRLWGAAARAVFGAHDATAARANGSRKYRVDAHGIVPFSRSRVALTGICVLARRPGDAAVRLTRLAPREALVTMVKLSYQIDVADRGRLAPITEQIARLVESVPVYRLQYARGLDRLDRIADQVLHEIGVRAQAGAA